MFMNVLISVLVYTKKKNNNNNVIQSFMCVNTVIINDVV